MIKNKATREPDSFDQVHDLLNLSNLWIKCPTYPNSGR